MAIPIIDLFAGPGGLGEGFTSLTNGKGERLFRIALSIEKDEFAHKTLTLRSFLRQFPVGKFPDEYYEMFSNGIDIESLFRLYPNEAAKAKKEAWKFELGNDETHEVIDNRIREALKGERKFVLIGGPPCQAYSLVGRSRRQETDGLNKHDPRVYLYREYYRILAVHNPMVFVMENVKGLLSSKVDDELIFTQLLNDLKNPVKSYAKLLGKKRIPLECPGYKIYSVVKEVTKNLYDDKSFTPRDFVVKCEEHGIPQTRHRVILFGVRNDLDVQPTVIQKEIEQIPLYKIIKGLPPVRSGLSKTNDSKEGWRESLKEIITNGLAESVNEDILNCIFQTVQKIQVPQFDRGGTFVACNASIGYKPEWFLDRKLSGVLNHETRSHIKEDLFRYMFAACYAKVKGVSPKISDFPKSLLPLHANLILNEKKFADRFRVQAKNSPSRTITSHISKDGHYYIHPDPSQCRSLTVREAARIQTFPDNYFFCGPRTQQYHQVGNAVPPLLAHKIAFVTANLFKLQAIS